MVNHAEERTRVGSCPPPPKRGRGTDKTPILATIEGFLSFIRKFVKTDQAVLMTDEFQSYEVVDEIMPHSTVNHGEKEYVKGIAHTNTIEGFWSMLKRAFHGTHHHYSKKWTPLYLAEVCFKWNSWKRRKVFERFLKECFV